MIVGSPTLPKTQYRAPILSHEDARFLQRQNIDMSAAINSGDYNVHNIHMIIGNDILSYITAQPNYCKYILPSGRALERTILGNIVHPIPKLALWNKAVDPPLSDEYQIAMNVANTLLSSCEPEDAMTKLTLQIAEMYSLVITLKKGVDLLSKYDTIITGQESAGFIEKVTAEMLKAEGPKYTIPHRGVVKEDSLTTKLRIVLDASSHARGELSLNDCLHAGTNMITPIFGILIRMRCPRFIIVADIEKAFHQVRLQPEFRNVTMFLWLKDITAPVSAENIEVYRFRRIPFGMSSSPFLLAAYITYNLDINPHELNEEIKDNLYVDNALFCTNDRSEIATKIKGTKFIFKRMDMNLREYIVNDPDTMESLPESEKAQATTIKLLGYKWNSTEDTLTVKIAVLDIDHPTKRDVASKLAETFDPLGLVSPIMVPFKRLMQRIWENGKSVNWKDRIPKELLPDWRALRNTFIDRELTVPRQLTSNYDYSEVHLLMFSDASQDMYAACCYACYIVKGETPVVTLLTSKNKIRPSKHESWTIPKLELLAIQLASNLACAIVAELRITINSIKLFTDSSCSIYWVLSENNPRQWVANRKTTINDNMKKMEECGIPTTIHHCPTKQNPADYATRGMSTREVQNSKMWFEGPSFLKADPSTWPCMIAGKVTCPAEFRELVYSEIIDPDTKKKRKPLMEKKVAKPAENVQRSAVEQKTDDTVMILNSQTTRPGSFIPYTATNSLQKLTKIVVLILKTFSIIKNKSWESPVMTQFLSSDCPLHQAKVARLLIITEHYKDCDYLDYSFPSDIEHFTDTYGVRRVHRRITSPVLPQEASEPILIHPRHPLAKLIARETHEINGHMPEVYTTSAIKTRYWIPKLGGILKNVIRGCVKCQKVNNFPFDYPYTKDLPLCRTTPSKPFSKVGLDYLGPIMYRGDDGQTNKKAYVLVYTCLITRGAVLRVVPDGTSQRYILTLKMIFREVGVPNVIFSDNASTFKLGGSMINKDIEDSVYSHSLVSFLASEVIDFKYITPLAPWQGGIYERIVKLVKHQLIKECGIRTYDFYDLQYIVSGAQAMVNNRPLIPHSRSPRDMIALRPMDFIAPGVMTEIPADSDKSDALPRSTEATVRAHINKMEAATDRLWETWSNGYLLHLRENMHTKKRSSLLRPAVGQLVIIVTKLLKRHKWPLGLIVHVERSKRDGQIRSAIVKCRGKLYSRAVSQLIPLELNPLNRPNIATEEETEDTQDSSPRELPAPAVLFDPNMKYAPELFPSKDLPNIAECENKNPDHKINESNIINLPLNLNTDHLENNVVSGDTDDDFDIIEKRLGTADTYQDPQRVLPAEAADDDFSELPAGRVRTYLSRKAKELPINYVHHAASQETAGTLPPGMLSTISLKTHLSTTERLNDEPHMVFPAKLGSSSPY
ncbi:hypothetical protein CRE_13318 [Caenorhabditis remanei]|uniref:Integrase catalytic domain-containing protein n=1 Tax=Caenorhabditis remanei TaxID=31234 RepID=E3M864_CAERE|nr:hypothetical protein CRE_13318 [Caenorhabditis remanei]